MAATKANIFLKGLEDWPTWDREFQKKAIAIDLWDYIKEGNDRKALLVEPEMPKLASLKGPKAGLAQSTHASALATPPISTGLNTDKSRNFTTA